MSHLFKAAANIRNLTYGWLLFAVTSAGIAGFLAFMVAMTRTPAVKLLPSARTFHVVLVGHVTFALTIWLLAFIAGLWTYFVAWGGAERGRHPLFSLRLGWAGLAVSMVGSFVLLASIIEGQGEALMTDYVPLLDTPVFHTGFAIFMAGILLTVLNLLLTISVFRRKETLSVPAYGVMIGGFCALIALASVTAAWLTLGFGAGNRPTFDYYQAFFWGMGHSLQYVSVVAMIVVWYVLAKATFGPAPSLDRWFKGVLTLFGVFVIPAPIFYIIHEAIKLPTTKAGVMLDSSLGLPVLLTFLLLGVWFKRSTQVSRRNLPWRKPEFSALLFSATLFAIGLGLQPVGALGTLRVPAHYHGVIVGGVTMAFMGMAYYLLPKLGRNLPNPGWAKIQPFLFAPGVLVMIAGLAWAGTVGAPRKAYDAAAAGALAWNIPMNLMGLGAFLAAAGGVVFVWLLLLALFRAPHVETQVEGQVIVSQL
jgi:heme/copper-type cytochrome/quinol oxidase subunit 1